MATKIEWADAVWNPTTGCTKVAEGCRHCYAEGYAQRFWNGRPFTDVQTHADRLEQPFLWKQGRRIFVDSMSDLFHRKVPNEFIRRVVMLDERASQHTFVILTKRPGRMMEFYRWMWLNHLWEVTPVMEEEDAAPRNIWLGVSVSNQVDVEQFLPLLLWTPATVRLVSAEPLLGEINLEEIVTAVGTFDALAGMLLPRGRTTPMEVGRVNWVISGGESGRQARKLLPDWARSLREQCKRADVAFWFKQLGEWNADGLRVGKVKAGKMLDGVDYQELP
jgi:protein gp37